MFMTVVDVHMAGQVPSIKTGLAPIDFIQKKAHILSFDLYVLISA